jgi:RHS repeat-associated protein
MAEFIDKERSTMITRLSRRIRFCEWNATGCVLLAIMVLLALYLLAATSASASNPTPPPLGPGWYTATADPVSPDEARRILFRQQRLKVDRLETEPSTLNLRLPTVETDATPEIQALARALRYDPKLIFDYVHNNIEYVPTFGSVNGATATYLAGRGNDWDQATLFIALMRASGYTANYVVGDVVYSVDCLASWVGVTNDANVVGTVFASGGVPMEGSSSPPGIKITRVWAQATISGTTYTFDPAMKAYRDTAGFNNLGATLGYSRTTFMQRAQIGATVTPSYTLNINEANVRADLATYAANLVDYIRVHSPTASLEQVIGGRRIVQSEMTSYPTALPYALSITNQATHTTIPDGYRHTLRVQHVGIDHTFNTFEIAAKRVTIFYDATDNYKPVLRVDGTPVVTGTATTLWNTYPMTVTIDHPYADDGGVYADQQTNFILYSGESYVIAHDFGGVSANLIAQRNRRLAQARFAGNADNSEPVLGESLWMMGLTWFDEVGLFNCLVNRLNNTLSLVHHQVGVAGQIGGYYLDISMLTWSSVSTDGVSSGFLSYQVQSMLSSALEHGVLEQLQGSNPPAVSTIRLLQVANSTGKKTFLANAGNWTSVRAQLVNYEALELSYLDALIAAGYELVLPEDGQLTVNQWRGSGYIKRFESGGAGGIGLMISGGYYGGWVSVPVSVKPDLLRILAEWDKPPLDEQGYKSVPVSKEPVSMATGAYLSGHTDLAVGLSEPLGLSFMRFYSSDDAYNLGVLGYGWTHNYEMSVAAHSAGDPVLGRRGATDAASAIAYAHVALDLLSTQLNPQGWTITSIASKWAMDQMIDNALTVSTGGKTLEYIKLADGSYNPPPGITTDLTADGSGYHLQDRFGERFDFDTAGRVTMWSDRNDNAMTFAYDAGGKLTSVADAFSRTLTFGYTGDRLTSVTDAGRSVGYTYANDQLTTFRDAENNYWGYAYDADNRLTQAFKADPPTQPLVTNIYDDFSRVITQTDALSNTSGYFFSGQRNVERYPDGSEVVYFFDNQGHMVGRQDQQGNRMVMSYNGLGQLVAATDRLGDTTTYTYHGETGRLASVTDAKSEVITYTYTARPTTRTNRQDRERIDYSLPSLLFTAYDLTRVDYPDGTYEQFTYDAQGNMTQETDQVGNVWNYAYNSRGQVTQIINPAGGVITHTYNADGTLATTTDSEVGVTTFTYDAYQRPVRMTHPDGTFSQFGYDRKDRVTSTTDERGNTTVFTYDANDNLISATDALSQTTQYAHDRLDRVTQNTDRLGKTSYTSYDSLGRTSVVTDATGVAMMFGYDSRGWLNRITRGSQSWLIGHDSEGFTTSDTTPLNHVTAYQSNEIGYTTVITGPVGQVASLAYDELNRLNSLTDPLNRTTTLGYDKNERLSRVTEPLVGAAAYQYDALDNLTRITDLNGRDWLFTYTPMGRLQSHTNPRSHTWQYAYDARGRLAQVTFPDSSTMTQAYDAAGNLTRALYSTGLDLGYTYDGLDRLVATTGISLTYDAEGGVINTGDTTPGDLTGFGNLSGLVTTNPNFGATYDDAGRLKTVSYANGAFTVTYTYSQTTGLLMRVSDSLSGAAVDFHYDADLRLIGMTRSNNVNTTFTWDNADRLTRIQDGSVLDLQYTLDAAGQVTQAQMTAPLDPANYLVGQATSLSYDAASQISSSGYMYDAQGRLATSPGHIYTWDGASQLIGVDTTTLGYNGLGDLTTRTEGITTTHYYYNYALGATPIVAEGLSTDLENGLNGETADPLQESVDSLQRYYVWAPGGDLLYMIDAAEGNKVYFYHFDRTGSTLALTDGAGNVTDAYAYDPYGKLLAHTGGSSQPFTFVGQWGARQEGNSGELYHIRARYYDAVTARFISPDPIWPQIEDPQQLNPYTYANNSPLNYVDVNGTEPDSSNYEKVKVKWQGRLPVYFKAGEKLVVDGRSVQVASSSFPVKANINLAAYGNPSTSPPQVDPSRLAKVQRMEPTNPNVRGRFVQPQYRQTPWYSKFNLAAGKDLLFGGLVGLAVGIGWEAWAEVSGWNKVQELQAQGRDREIFNRNGCSCSCLPTGLK